MGYSRGLIRGFYVFSRNQPTKAFFSFTAKFHYNVATTVCDAKMFRPKGFDVEQEGRLKGVQMVTRGGLGVS